MKPAQMTYARKVGGRVLVAAIVLMLPMGSVASADMFVYEPVELDDIVSATFSADVASFVAHRTIGGIEVNRAKLWDQSHSQFFDLSEDLFGAASWPDPNPLVNQGAAETGWISAEVDSSFFPCLAEGAVDVQFLFTDTDDAQFAIDTLVLSIETSSRGTITSFYGAPVGNENNGFGIGIPDGGDLPGPLAVVLGSTGTGFDEVISSKGVIPEPSSLLLFGTGLLILPRLRRPGHLVVAVAVLAGGMVAAPAAAANVLAGSDLLTTPPGTDPSVSVPGDFFDPGSDPFAGTIELEGLPLDPGNLGTTDTIVQRLEDAILPGWPSEDTVPTQIVALRLKSVEPIMVTYNSGQNPEPWDVKVCLRHPGQPIGSMTIRCESEVGGTFDSQMPVEVQFIFTRRSDLAVRILDVDDVLAVGGIAWAHSSSSFGLVVPAPVVVDGDCDGAGDLPLPGTANFVAGVAKAPDESCEVLELTEEQMADGRKHGAHPPGFTDVSCCKLNGQCWPLAEGAGVKECKEAGGTPMGGEGASCEDPGDCCMPDGRIVHPSNECCCELRGGEYIGDGRGASCLPMQLHLTGLGPDPVPSGSQGTIIATLQLSGFEPAAGRHLTFTKQSDPLLTGTYRFTSGTVSEDGTQATVTTDEDGHAEMTFFAEALGPGLVKVTPQVGDLAAYAFFQIVPPLNDDCADAILLELPSTTAGCTLGATVDGAPFCGTSNTAPGVWYKVLGTGDIMLATLCNEGTDYDTKLAVYTDGCGILTCVAGNDDDPYCPYSTLQSTVEWCSQLDREYLILVHGYSAYTGDFVLNVMPGPPQLLGACCFADGTCEELTECGCQNAGGDYIGDEVPCDPSPCCTPDFVVTAPGIWTGNTCGAGNDCDVTGSDGEDYIYEVTIPAEGDWRFSLCNSAYDTKIGVGTTCCSEDVGYNDDDCDEKSLQSEVTATLTAGTYYVTVDAYDTYCGDYELVIDVPPPPPTGACCQGMVCAATVTEAQCDDAGGTFWAEGETCPEYDCPCYCDTCWTNDTDDWITNVTFNTINNTTVNEGDPCSYGDYTALSTAVVRGTTYTLSVSFYSGIYTECVRAWIDWNQDCVFDTATEQYNLGSGVSTTKTIQITIPTGADLGDTVMRVTERYYTCPGPCDMLTYGETEDYTVTVQSAVAPRPGGGKVQGSGSTQGTGSPDGAVGR